jgi:hypothetical protein
MCTREFSLLQDRLSGPSNLSDVYRRFSPDPNRPSLKLTAVFHLLMRLRMCAAINSLSQCLHAVCSYTFSFSSQNQI